MRAHTMYLAVIAALILVIVYVAARAARAGRTLADLEERFGLREPLRASAPRREPLRAHAARDLLRPRTLDQYRREVDALLGRAQALEEFGAQTRLSAACGSALEGGKRLRAIVLLEV